MKYAEKWLRGFLSKSLLSTLKYKKEPNKKTFDKISSTLKSDVSEVATYPSPINRKWNNTKTWEEDYDLRLLAYSLLKSVLTGDDIDEDKRELAIEVFMKELDIKDNDR